MEGDPRERSEALEGAMGRGMADPFSSSPHFLKTPKFSFGWDIEGEILVVLNQPGQ